MKFSIKFPIIFIILFFCLASGVWCQGSDFEEIIVTATKTPTAQAEIGTSFTVITDNQMKEMGKSTVLDVLKDVPGISFSQSGQYGGAASVFMRGSNPGHTLVLIDGVEVNDPMHINRAYDFSHLTVCNVEKIEIIRGPQSTLYGSDALGGVINIITKKGSKKNEVEIFTEYGSADTYKESIAVRGSKGKLNYSASLSRLDTAGISKANGQEQDPYENTTFSSKISYDISDMTFIDMTLRYIKAEVEIDDGANEDDPNRYSKWEDFAIKTSVTHMIGDWWEQIFSYSFSELYRKDLDFIDEIDAGPFEYSKFTFKGFNRKLEWQHILYTEALDKTMFGLEYEEESGTSSSFSDKKELKNGSYYFQNQFAFFDSFFITPGIRVDDHEKYGTEMTYKVSARYNLDKTDTTFKANYGTGIKSPSLYQIYSPYGQESLKAEESKGYDIGVEQKFFKKKMMASVMYFYNDFDNMIDWVSTGAWTGQYENTDEAETKGYEVSFIYEPVKNLRFGADFTYLKTKDRKTGQELLRRPKRKATFRCDWKFLDKHKIYAGVNFVGSRKDYEWSSGVGRRVILDEYTTVDLAYTYYWTKYFELMFRIENLFDEDYEQIYGYDTKGTSYYISGRLKI